MEVLRSNALTKDGLFIAGITLYWAEGSKTTDGTVDFANSDPKMVKLFLRYLRECCRVAEDKLRILLYCYANQDIEKLKNYWSKVTKIPVNQFTKPYKRKDFLEEKVDKLPKGLVHIRYSDKKLLNQILDMIDVLE